MGATAQLKKVFRDHLFACTTPSKNEKLIFLFKLVTDIYQSPIILSLCIFISGYSIYAVSTGVYEVYTPHFSEKRFHQGQQKI